MSLMSGVAPGCPDSRCRSSTTSTVFGSRDTCTSVSVTAAVPILPSTTAVRICGMSSCAKV